MADRDAEIVEHSEGCSGDICVCPDDVFWGRLLGDDDPCAPGKDWAEAAFGCDHDWMLRPESDTHVCLICGEER